MDERLDRIDQLIVQLREHTGEQFSDIIEDLVDIIDVAIYDENLSRKRPHIERENDSGETIDETIAAIRSEIKEIARILDI